MCFLRWDHWGTNTSTAITLDKRRSIDRSVLNSGEVARFIKGPRHSTAVRKDSKPPRSSNRAAAERGIIDLHVGYRVVENAALRGRRRLQSAKPLKNQQSLSG